LKYELKIINARTNSIDETLSADDFYGLSVKYRQYYIAHPEGGYYYSFYTDGFYDKQSSANWVDFYISKYVKEIHKLEKIKDDF
jgi:hypothetical protein